MGSNRIAVVGLGFLAADVVFRSVSQYQVLGHWLAAIIGVGAVILGSGILYCATRDYFHKQQGFNTNTYCSPHLSVWVTFASLGLGDVFLLILEIVLLIY